jgi:hypothetical protein
MSGSVNYHAGLAAEEIVAADYARRGLHAGAGAANAAKLT